METVTCWYQVGHEDYPDTCRLHEGAVCELEIGNTCKDYEEEVAEGTTDDF